MNSINPYCITLIITIISICDTFAYKVNFDDASTYEDRAKVDLEIASESGVFKEFNIIDNTYNGQIKIFYNIRINSHGIPKWNKGLMHIKTANETNIQTLRSSDVSFINSLIYQVLKYMYETNDVANFNKYMIDYIYIREIKFISSLIEKVDFKKFIHKGFGTYDKDADEYIFVIVYRLIP